MSDLNDAFILHQALQNANVSNASLADSISGIRSQVPEPATVVPLAVASLLAVGLVRRSRG
ncbi:PEP-CTERM sorting domain-containing protein [Aeoliella sp.]|uniref:PEP-CTERM sorting domain-containing protein n=1 Tax=Aeoliella sp. TaxID=2795800 RepID=UPI003CCB8676